MEYVSLLQNRLRNLSPIKSKLLLTGAFFSLLTLCLLLIFLKPTYAVLFNQLDEKDANRIVQKLDEENITWKLQNHGKEILIDKSLIDKTRLKIMSDGNQSIRSVGLELFDKADFGMTDYSQKINFQRALQGELERTISSLEEVKQARVHLVIPEKHLFDDANNLPRAAVSLQLNRPLNAHQVLSIQQLISASVANLPKNNVVMVDQNGNSLSATEEETKGNRHFAEKQLYENYLRQKVFSMLSKIFNPNDIAVNIDATFNYDELEQELIHPEDNGSITHEKEILHTGEAKDQKTAGKQDITREKTYEHGQKKEHFSRANGRLERLTISVALPGNSSSDSVLRVEKLVKAVVGFNENRGDFISVEAIVMHFEALPLETHATQEYPVYSILHPLFFLPIFLCFSGLVLIQHLRFKKRKYLLSQLNQWLEEHD